MRPNEIKNKKYKIKKWEKKLKEKIWNMKQKIYREIWLLAIWNNKIL